MEKKWLMDLMMLIRVICISIDVQGSTSWVSQIWFTNKNNTGTENKDVSLAKEFNDNLEGEHRQNGAIDQEKSEKKFIKRKWT